MLARMSPAPFVQINGFRIRMMRGDEFANRRLQLSHAAMDAPPQLGRFSRAQGSLPFTARTSWHPVTMERTSPRAGSREP